MKKKGVAIILASSLVMSGCGKVNPEPSDAAQAISGVTSEAVTEEKESAENTSTDNTGDSAISDAKVAAASESVIKMLNTSFLGDSEDVYYNKNLVPSVAPNSVLADFSNVVYEDEFSYLFDPEENSDYNPSIKRREMLINNNFCVEDSRSNEFFDVYESNRYVMFPSFVTVDSLLHTYHIYFAYLMEKTEKEYLSKELVSLSTDMLKESENQYKELAGSKWEEAAKRNLIFFNVANMLLETGESITDAGLNAEISEVSNSEYEKINSAEGIDNCALTGLMEDYSQYKPRGYYVGTEELEKYFRAMMWYGRIPFALDDEESVKSAALMTMAIAKSPGSYGSIYCVTSFFAGASDDPGFKEFSLVFDKAYGKIPSASEIKDDDSGLAKMLEEVKTLPAPKINSIPVMDEEDPVIPSFRFMGQRFTIDAAIMQRLIYSSTKENAQGEKRMLPDTLDVPAALGSDMAYELLEEMGATEFENYKENLAFARAYFDNDDPKLWNASLYSGWLNILRPLLEEKKEGYPSYMTNDEWTKKNLETFAGSFAELKHDTILYAKQIMAEMGGGDEDPLDDRGYVDPQPEVYSRFLSLSNKTKEGLLSLGMLSESQQEDLDKLSEIAKELIMISEKELTNEALTDEEYEFIRCYGGYIEHFWREANNDKVEDGVYNSYQVPCPVVADIATDPNGSVLEIGSGFAENVLVVFPIDGELHIARGSVYSFYQFETPISDRLTDEEFKDRLIGGYYDDDWNYVEIEETVDRAPWTGSYRIIYED